MVDKDNKSKDYAKELKDIGITVKKSDDFSEWYQQVIIKSEFTDYSAVSGCIIYRPESYLIWEKIVKLTDAKLKASGIKNSYFPILIPERLLIKESTHLEGFSPEVAWVTHAGDTELEEKLAIRPTSETIMYDSYNKWIRSWRDLPLRLAQWNNVIRWEFKHAVPILRSREFLWVEGHTAYATKEEAEAEGLEIIRIWEEVLKEYLAVAFFTGKKSKKETFAGAEYTISLENVLPNGKAIQGPDFHHDGQIFSKAYDIKFLNKNGEQEFVHQNTWAITIRQMGIMLGIHGDDKGIIVPPRVAPIQIVIVPILFDDSMDKVFAKCNELKEELSAHRYHEFQYEVLVDNSDYRPGWKFNHWELKGIPLRIEIGPKDLEKGHVVMVRRDDGKKEFVKFGQVVSKAKEILDDIQSRLYENSKKIMDSTIVQANTLDDTKRLVADKKIILAPYCDDGECEDYIKEVTGGAKVLNSPLKQEKNTGLKCINCGKPARLFYFGKSY
ncbi:MAG: proline--tRNA ligase [Candidatus Woesearchaeota archaeon]